jgi:hypothetical protein
LIMSYARRYDVQHFRTYLFVREPRCRC